MIEPRLTSVILLDGSQLDFFITPDFLTCELIDMVSTHLMLTDKDYFGLSFLDSTGHKNWLQPEKKILDHELSRKNGVLILYFSVKFFIESIAYTKDRVAVELFFLQARQLIYQEDLEVNNELIFELGALVLQSLFGDYKSDKETIQEIKNQNIVPKHFFSTLNQAHYCYLSIIEKLCNYGVHYYEVKDKLNSKWLLGISFRGIGLYEYNNKIISKKIFPWSKLENLYYRDRKFSIEVHESQTQSQCTSNLANYSPKTNTSDTLKSEDTFNPVKVYAWFASIPSLCKSIWLMAVAQHQFYLDKKQNRDNILQFKSLNDLALELNNTMNTQSYFIEELDDSSSKNKSISSDKQINNNFSQLQKQSEKKNNTKLEMLNLYKKQKEILLSNLEQKRKQLDDINNKQQELLEINNNSSRGDQIHRILKIINEFKNSFTMNQRTKTLNIENLIMQNDVQKKIMLMALNLASDPTVNKLTQKQRREFYEKSKKKLTILEKKIEEETGRSREQDSLIADKSSSDKNENNFNCYNNIDLRLHQIEESFSECSPASIHRKDSYRRAQEQKLFLENNPNRQNRFNTARKVKTINQDQQQLLQNQPIKIHSNRSQNGTNNHNGVSNHNNNIHHFNHSQKINTIGDFVQISNSPAIQEQKLIDSKNKSISYNEMNTADLNKFGNQDVTDSGFIGQHNHMFKLGDDSPNINYFNDEICRPMSNHNGNNLLNMNNNIFINPNKKIINHNLFLNGNSSNGNNNNQYHAQEIIHNNGCGSNGTSNLLLTKKCNQRKNTSDSNVKLLADHNFYHVTNRRNEMRIPRERENHVPFAEIHSSDLSSSNKRNDITKFNIISKPYEINDYFKYSSKYRRGLNSSSNSLISLNSSRILIKKSVGTNEDSNSNGNNNSNSHSNNNTTNSVEREVIRSNPDLKTALINSPVSTSSREYQQQQHNDIIQYENNCYPGNSIVKGDLSNLSNNLSLNLSIHTAEEFGIEMLAWLNNETNSSTSNNISSNLLKIEKELAESKLGNNATLV